MPNGPEENTPLNEAVALLVLDIQGAFLPVIHESNTFLSRCAFAIEAARVFGIQTFFTEQVPEKLGRSHSHLIQLADDPEIFHKTAFSAFRAEGLEEYLKKHGIYHLLIIGLEIPVCVYQTVLQAIDHEIDVTLLSDCLGSRRPQDTPAVLSSLAQMGCNILPSEAVFYSLLGDTTHPDFKPYTELVKKYAKDIEIKDEPHLLSIPQRKNSKTTRERERNKNDQQPSSKASHTEALSPQSSQSRAKQNQGSRRKSDPGRTSQQSRETTAKRPEQKGKVKNENPQRTSSTSEPTETSKRKSQSSRAKRTQRPRRTSDSGEPKEQRTKATTTKPEQTRKRRTVKPEKKTVSKTTSRPSRNRRQKTS